jgi:hypothetical protein
MKIVNAILLLILLSAVPAFGQWAKNGEKAEDSPDRKAVKGFGAHLILVENPYAFINQWMKPETPKIPNVVLAPRGKFMGALVLFAGCQPSQDGKCNTEVDYTMYKPDGSIYAERKGLELWKDQAPPSPNIQMGKAILGFRIQKNDSKGQYKVKAKVYDLNANISFDLEIGFLVPTK